MDTPILSGGCCLGGEAAILVNDGIFNAVRTRVRLPTPPLIYGRKDD